MSGHDRKCHRPPQSVILQVRGPRVLAAALVGGALGSLAGVFGSRAIATSLGWPVHVSANAILLALGFAGGIGIFFGFYPASKAASLDPIDALRFE